ncbi:MAG TPA: GNAT family N-acetyltransferase [Ktedonobacterales bacterium]|nr:GNAT family N-acetyltransferase [Ktedonobacterales bacterium]
MQGVQIRRATEQDIEALLALHIDLHEFHVQGLPDWMRIPEAYQRDESRAWLQDLIQREDAAIFVAEASGKLVGLVDVTLEETTNQVFVPRRYGYIQGLVVSEALRKQGLGTQLLEAVRRWAIEHGAAEIQLEMWEFPAGPFHFYEAVGFQTIKRRLVKAL